MAINAGQIVTARDLNAQTGSQARATADLTTTATAADVTGASLSVTTTTVNSVATIIGTFDVDITAAVTGTWTFQGQCVVDGVLQSGVATLMAAAGTRVTTTQVWVVSLASPGTHTLQLRALRSGAGGTVLVRQIHTAITAIVT